jgi:isoleucyl-tRNA synthetase
MRELLRGLQVYRKEVGLEIEDRIEIRYDTRSATIATIVERFGDYLKAELLATSFDAGEASGGKAFTFDGESVTVAVSKA